MVQRAQNINIESATDATTTQVFDDNTSIGDNGLMIVTNWAQGNAIGIWDGDSTLSFNFYFSNDLAEDDVNFAELFDEREDFVIPLKNFDLCPRGIGNIVMFQEDIHNIQSPVWA